MFNKSKKIKQLESRINFMETQINSIKRLFSEYTFNHHDIHQELYKEIKKLTEKNTPNEEKSNVNIKVKRVRKPKKEVEE